MRRQAFEPPERDVPPCDGCHQCKRLYDGNREELFAWTGRKWLCRNCAMKIKAPVVYTECHDHDVIVRLTKDEFDFAVGHGLKMRRTSKTRRHKDRGNYDPDEDKAKRVQCLGAIAELVVRKHLRKPIWLPEQTYKEPDIGPDIGVRLIGEEWYGLRVYPHDEDWLKVVGVVIPRGKEREPYRIAGWFLAGEAKKNDRWKMNPKERRDGGSTAQTPMWCVPQRNLRDLAELEER